MITPERLKEIIFNCYPSYFDGIEYLATALLDKFEIREKGNQPSCLCDFCNDKREKEANHIQEAYDKYRHLDELLSDREFLDEKNIRAMILYDLWQVIKHEAKE